MAINVLSDFSAALTDDLAPRLRRQFNRLSVLVGILDHEDGAGPTCAWDVQFTGATAATFSEGADVSTYDNDIEVKASLSWGQYRHNFALSGLAQAAAQSAKAVPQEFLNLIGDRADTGAQVLASKLDLDCFAGTGANAIIGLNSGLATSGTYAGILRSTYTEWKGNVVTNSGTAWDLTKARMDTLEKTIFDACGMPPNVIVASSGVCAKYESLFDSVSRVQIARDLAIPATALSVGSPIPDVLAGYTGLTYKGMPVYRARNCQTGRLYMLNTTSMKLRSLPAPRRNTSADASTVQLTTNGEQRKPIPLNVVIEALAKTGDADKFTVKVYPQLVVLNPNRNGYMDDISE